jgi:cytochrome c oxidase assembly factor CtaG
LSGPYAFSFEPLFLVLGVLALVAYVRARPGPWWRVVLFGVGLALVVVPVNSPLETIATERLLLVHLLQNVMLSDWAPPLLILGLTPAMRASLARIGGRPFAALTRPVVSLPVWLVGWYAIHWGVFYDFALRHPAALNVEHLILLSIGLLFWWPLLSDAPRRLTTPVKIAYLGAAFVASAFLGLAFTFSTSPFYAFYARAPRLWGLSPAKDQNLGGILMNGEQTAVFLAALAYFLWRLLEEEHVSGSTP